MATVSNEGMRRYLSTYRVTYLEAANRHIPDEARHLLFRYPLVAGRTIGYVSTQFGAAFEYALGSGDDIEVVSGSARVEDLFLGAPARVLSQCSQHEVEGHGSIAYKVGLLGSMRLLKVDSSILLIDCHFCEYPPSIPPRIPPGWTRNVSFAELFGNRSEEFWSEAQAVQRAMEEVFVAAMQWREAELRQVSLYEYLADMRQHHVLVLGDFDAQGRQRLDAIRAALVDLGYDTVTLDEIPDLDLSLPQKAIVYSTLARFVVADDSSKSGHIYELAKIADARAVTIILRLEGSEGTWMTRLESEYSNVALESDYTSATLPEVIRKSCEWAEDKVRTLVDRQRETYPWRRPKPCD